MYFKRDILYTPNAENLYKGAAWNLFKRDKGLSNNFLFTSYKYVTFGYPKVRRPTYLIVISTDDIVPNKPQILIWYGILTVKKSTYSIDLNMLVRIWQGILFSLLSLGYVSQRWHTYINLS